jgi:hypothetical protein
MNSHIATRIERIMHKVSSNFKFGRGILRCVLCSGNMLGVDCFRCQRYFLSSDNFETEGILEENPRRVLNY